MNASETAHFATEVADPMTKTVICASVYRRRVEKKQAEDRRRQTKAAEPSMRPIRARSIATALCGRSGKLVGNTM